jgi:hypothetical protein
MICKTLRAALHQAQFSLLDLNGIVAVPSLNGGFMEAHYQANALGMFEQRKRPLWCRTLDTGCAGPISALLQAERMIQNKGLECVAVVAADTVGSMDSEEFLDKADKIFFKLGEQLGHSKEHVMSPAIPHGYDRITQYQMKQHALTRNQLQMAVTLESFHAALHPQSLQSQKANTNKQQGNEDDIASSKLHYHSLPTTLAQVKASPSITSNISLLECARRADGCGVLVLASSRFLQRRSLWTPGIPFVIGGGAFLGPLYPPKDPAPEITDYLYASCQQAMTRAYA